MKKTKIKLCEDYINFNWRVKSKKKKREDYILNLNNLIFQNWKTKKKVTWNEGLF